MSLFCWKRCQCRKRCDGFFPHNIQLREGCRSMCSDTKDVQPEDYIRARCETDPGGLTAAYGYDICADYGYTLEDYVDAVNEPYAEKDAARQKNLIIVAVVLFAVLAVLISEYVK